MRDPNSPFSIKMLLISIVTLCKVTVEHELVLTGGRKACGSWFCMEEDGILVRFQVIIICEKF